MEASGFNRDEGAEVDRFWDQAYLEKTKDISEKGRLTFALLQRQPFRSMSWRCIQGQGSHVKSVIMMKPSLNW